MTDIPSPLPSMEIFMDGTNFLLARSSGGFPFHLDLNLFATRLSRGYHFVKLRYNTSPLPDVQSAAFQRQQKFFEELRRSRRIELVLGPYEARRDRDGRRYHVEKETDVNLAVDMVTGAYEDRFDVAILVSGDTDYVHAIRTIQARGKGVIWCYLPSQRHTHQLEQLCDGKRELS